ncbi:glycosyltransferase [Flavobacterium sp. N2820]|uniref:glycosyltransferase n=1 Tax=Flavobacterium sp. N2820 TaxID=2986834 RepID=UPI002224CDA2|nr:glycosyltransferase [Flavobacterium sp. N2820]
MNNFPLVSIVIPVYNGSNYLAEAIDSALAQTYSNIEIIVVNDGSNDFGETKKVACSYGNTIRYFEKENGGVSTALNLGIQEMKGDYFSWLSHDDKYFPEKIESQINFLIKNKAKNVLLYSDIEYIDKDSKFISVNKFPHYTPEEFRPAFIVNGLVHGCTLLIPRICFEECGVFNTSLRTTQDYELWFRFSAKFHFIHLPCILVYSRIHDNQDTIKLSDIVFEERDNLHNNFILNIREEEIKLFSKNNISKYYIEFAEKMNALRCVNARQSAINQAFSHLLKNNLLKMFQNLIQLIILILKIKGRKLLYS